MEVDVGKGKSLWLRFESIRTPPMIVLLATLRVPPSDKILVSAKCSVYLHDAELHSRSRWLGRRPNTPTPLRRAL